MEWLQAVLAALAACWLASKLLRWARTLWQLSRLPHPRMGLLGCTEMMMDQDHISQVMPPAAWRRIGAFLPHTGLPSCCRSSLSLPTSWVASSLCACCMCPW